MKITIICVGKIKEKYLSDAIAEYSKRLSKYCKLEIIQLQDEKTIENASETVNRQIKDKEGERLLRQMKDGTYLIALAIQGKKLDSVAFSEKIASLGLHGTSDIGSAAGEGFYASVRFCAVESRNDCVNQIF